LLANRAEMDLKLSNKFASEIADGIIKLCFHFFVIKLVYIVRGAVVYVNSN